MKKLSYAQMMRAKNLYSMTEKEIEEVNSIVPEDVKSVPYGKRSLEEFYTLCPLDPNTGTRVNVLTLMMRGNPAQRDAALASPQLQLLPASPNVKLSDKEKVALTPSRYAQTNVERDAVRDALVNSLERKPVEEPVEPEPSVTEPEPSKTD